MSKDEVLEKADSESMKEAFSAWYKYDVNQDMDVHTEIAWKNWQTAWNAALAQLYTVPQQRNPMTKEEVEHLFCSKPSKQLLFRVAAIERWHGIRMKNNYD